jgi:hypothetical protein
MDKKFSCRWTWADRTILQPQQEIIVNSKLKAGWMALAAVGIASMSMPAMAAMAPMPVEQHQGSVGYITGGIGERQAKLFEHQMSKHPLAIELLQHAGKREEFTADAMVKIADMHGHTVLDAKAGGPFMLVDLPPGRYSVVATLNHDSLKKSTVLVSHGKVARATFEFPAHTDG